MRALRFSSRVVTILLVLLVLGTVLPIGGLMVEAAQIDTFIPLERVPGIEYDPNNLSGYFNDVFRVGVGVAAFLAVIMLMLGGFQYLTSDIPGQKSDGKERMSGAILGLLLILLSVVLLNVINPDITGLKLFIPNIKTPPADPAPAPAEPPPTGAAPAPAEPPPTDEAFGNDVGF